MKKIAISLILITLVATLICSHINPAILGENKFLNNFVYHQLLNIFAIIMTVTLASAANIHLAFNRAEEIMGQAGAFKIPRREVNFDALALVLLFVLSTILLIIQSAFTGSVVVVSYFNSVFLTILLMYILTLIDITLVIFELHPIEPNNSN